MGGDWGSVVRLFLKDSFQVLNVGIFLAIVWSAKDDAALLEDANIVYVGTSFIFLTVALVGINVTLVPANQVLLAAAVYIIGSCTLAVRFAVAYLSGTWTVSNKYSLFLAAMVLTGAIKLILAAMFVLLCVSVCAPTRLNRFYRDYNPRIAQGAYKDVVDALNLCGLDYEREITLVADKLGFFPIDDLRAAVPDKKGRRSDGQKKAAKAYVDELIEALNDHARVETLMRDHAITG